MKYPSEWKREAERTAKRVAKTGDPTPRARSPNEYALLTDNELYSLLPTVNKRETTRIMRELARRLTLR
jgi:hypothetical protein